MEVLGAIAPSLGVGLLFWWVIRAVLRADRTEREESARLELEHRAEDRRAEERRAEERRAAASGEQRGA